MRRDRIQSLLRLHGRRRLSECQGGESVKVSGRQDRGRQPSSSMLLLKK
jgi:hypothetical protein